MLRDFIVTTVSEADEAPPGKKCRGQKHPGMRMAHNGDMGAQRGQYPGKVPRHRRRQGDK